VLFVGMLSGTYSSIFIATPVLADLKERQPEYKDLAVKVKRRLAGGRRAADTASTTAASAVTPANTAVRDEEPQVDDPAGPDNDLDDDNDGVAVSAAAARPANSPASPSSTRPTPASRPQPRTGGSAQRRPGARKKRR
jgi:preprotein translocase subunit SecF